MFVDDEYRNAASVVVDETASCANADTVPRTMASTARVTVTVRATFQSSAEKLSSAGDTVTRSDDPTTTSCTTEPVAGAVASATVVVSATPSTVDAGIVRDDHVNGARNTHTVTPSGVVLATYSRASHSHTDESAALITAFARSHTHACPFTKC